MTDAIPAYLKPEINRLDQKIAEAKASLADPQLKTLAQEEIDQLEQQKQALLQPAPAKTINKAVSISGGSIIIEVRPGAGGEEAKIWAEDLLNMYTRFSNGQRLEVLKLADGVVKIKGKQAYSLFAFEAGVHRVQRIPTTEAHGRLHTSTATVAVLPEVQESAIVISPKDIEIHFTHSSSQGGQNVQKVSTAVRIVHKPSGIITSCQTQRFQEQNRKIALEMLRSKLYQLEEDKRQLELNQARSAVGRAMRAEKVRTYNFPQNRVTDHRIGKSWKALDRILQGDLLPLVKSLAGPKL
ncbi:PCRF domain-containing protein [Patescibacteria group bacterium]|nr:PCRF domain-containing protein [Patescibacteria group bacterium]